MSTTKNVIAHDNTAALREAWAEHTEAWDACEAYPADEDLPEDLHSRVYETGLAVLLPGEVKAVIYRDRIVVDWEFSDEVGPETVRSLAHVVQRLNPES